MRYIPRRLTRELQRAARAFPAVVLTGPRRAGKTTLLRRAFPAATYRLLEDPEIVARVRSDPATFLDEIRLPVLLDEIQNTPELLPHIRARIDAAPRQAGRWLVTGSQDAPLMRGVTESMAGRAALLELWPLSTRETPRVSLVRGGFPEVLARPRSAQLWYRSYVQTYLERDVRAISSIRDLATFRRFLALVASRCGQILNKTDLAAPLGVSVPTVTEWLAILEVTGQIVLVPPYYENLGKRLIKSPKLHFVDSGLACHLLGLESETRLRSSPFQGPLFEGFVVAEVLKQQQAEGRRREVYYFRDQRGLEVDLLVPLGGKRLALVEAKASATVRPEAGRSVTALAGSATGYETRGFVVYRPRPSAVRLSALRPGVRAVRLEGLLTFLSRG
jgi:predicted AAA+ superfamily ATPase